MITDVVESLEGSSIGAAWSVTYTLQGKLYGAAIDARGAAEVFPNDPNASAPAEGQPSVWSAPVELTAPNFSHFVVHYRAGGPTDGFVEGLDGTRQGDKLVVRYFIKGKLWGSKIDAHAAGTLSPRSAE